MAVTFDASTTPWARVNAVTTMTVAHTCSGANRLLVVNAGTSGTVTGVTYNGVAMTQVNTSSTDTSSNSCSAWILIAPALWTNNVVITTSASATIMCHIASYNWALQSWQPDISIVAWPTTVTSWTQTVTTTVDNDFLIMCAKGKNGNAITAGANTLIRCNIETLFTGLFIADSNWPRTPTGLQSLNVTSLCQEYNGIMFAVKPATTTNSSSIIFF